MEGPRGVALCDERMGRMPLRKSASIALQIMSFCSWRLRAAVVDLFCPYEHRFQPDAVYFDRRALYISSAQVWFVPDTTHASLSAAVAWDITSRIRCLGSDFGPQLNINVEP